MSELANLTGAGVPAPSPTDRRLTAAQFQTLAEVPAAVEWFAYIDNLRIRRAYQGDLEDFCRFVGLATADEFRSVARAHVLAWRSDLERRCLAGRREPLRITRRWMRKFVIAPRSGVAMRLPDTGPVTLVGD